jgi:hypothetical protein
MGSIAMTHSNSNEEGVRDIVCIFANRDVVLTQVSLSSALRHISGRFKTPNLESSVTFMNIAERECCAPLAEVRKA